MVEPKRHLPILKSANEPGGAGDEAAPRRAWQWVGFGTLGIVTTWVPLAAIVGALASALARRAEAAAMDKITWIADAEVAVVGSYVVVLALGAFAGGFLVGRWGPGHVGVREAALAGLGASVIAVAATWLAFGSLAGVWLVAAVATPSAAVGGRLGVRGRPR